MNPIFVGPIAPERNPPIQPQDYKPKVFVIDQIVPINDEFTGVVTDIDNDFVVGQIIRFVIPKRDGMQPLNGQEAVVAYIFTPTVFIAEINALHFDSFNPLGNLTQDAFVIPVGDINTGAINSSGRINNLLYIRGAFINIS